MFKQSLLLVSLLTISLCATSSVSSAVNGGSSNSKSQGGVTRNILYVDQTVGGNGQNLSLLPLIQHPTRITHIILFSLYFDENATVFYQGAPLPHKNTTGQLADAKVLQQNGVKVLMCLGGAGNQPFNQLAANFTKFYPPLLSFLRQHSFDGLDLDVELPTTQAATIHLLQALRADLGPDFILTMAPVSSTMVTGVPIAVSGNLDYHALDDAAIYNPNTASSPWPLLSTTSTILSIISTTKTSAASTTSATTFDVPPGQPPIQSSTTSTIPSSLSTTPSLPSMVPVRLISFFNVQFFAGGASGGSVFDTYTKIIEEGGWEPERIVAGIASFNLLGWNRIKEYKGNLSALREKYGSGRFGGVVGWNYFHAGNDDRNANSGEGEERRLRWVEGVGEGVFGEGK